MNGGPFRDTLTPLIDEAQRQLAELQRQRMALEIRYQDARKRLDEKTALAPSPDAAVLEGLGEHEFVMPPLETLKTPFIAGLVLGALSWFQTFRHPR
jgi:lipase chaperone LimK